jgi:hypothetical protein
MNIRFLGGFMGMNKSKFKTFEKILIGLLVTILGGVLVALLTRQGRFATNNTSDISISIKDASQFKATKLLFFEAGKTTPKPADRNYKNRFKKEATRYIHWELLLEHPAFELKKKFNIDYVFYAPDGKIFGQETLSTEIERNRRTSLHLTGWGWEKAGNWPVGHYQLSLSIEGEKIAGGSFEIYEYSITKEAKASRLLFFEAGRTTPKPADRNYKNRFKKEATRYIHWELLLEHPAFELKKKFNIDYVFYAPDGKIFGQETLSTEIKKNRRTSLHLTGWGWEKAGNWPVGHYQLSLSIEGEKIAGGSFEVY